MYGVYFDIHNLIGFCGHSIHKARNMSLEKLMNIIDFIKNPTQSKLLSLNFYLMKVPQSSKSNHKYDLFLYR